MQTRMSIRFDYNSMSEINNIKKIEEEENDTYLNNV